MTIADLNKIKKDYISTQTTTTKDPMKYFILFLLLIPGIAFSQQSKTVDFWRVTVSSTVTGEKISGAAMAVKKRNFIANNDGLISVDKAYIGIADTLNLSCVGYQSKKIIVGNNFTYPDSLKLSPLKIALNEVVVNSAKPPLKIGVIKKAYNSQLRGNPNTIYAQYIPNDKRISGTITTIEYFVNNISGGIERPFKVGIYTKGENDIFPDKDLLNDSVVVFNPKKKKKIVVDVSKYNIPFPKDGVMAVFETLCPESYGSDLYRDNGRLYSRIPGIDIDLKNKGDYETDAEKLNRTTPFALVMSTTADGRFTIEYVHYNSFLYVDGSNFGIVITVEQ